MCPFLHFNNYNIAVAVPKGYDRLGQKKQPFLEIAKDRTGLNEKQIRVHLFLLYHVLCRSIGLVDLLPFFH